jgi:hypothetical protein
MIRPELKNMTAEIANCGMMFREKLPDDSMIA